MAVEIDQVLIRVINGSGPVPGVNTSLISCQRIENGSSTTLSGATVEVGGGLYAIPLTAAEKAGENIGFDPQVNLSGHYAVTVPQLGNVTPIELSIAKGWWPRGYTGPRPFDVWWDPVARRFNTSVDSLDSFRAAYMNPVGVENWVDEKNGSDTLGTGSKDSPWKSIKKAIDEGADTIHVQAGVYPRGSGFATKLTKNTNLIAEGGTVWCGCNLVDQPMIEVEPNVWQTTVPVVIGVCGAKPSDLDDKGRPIPFTLVGTDPSDLSGVVGEYTYEPVSDVLSIYWPGGSQPVWNVDIFVLRNQIDNQLVDPGFIGTAFRIYMEGDFHFLGGPELRCAVEGMEFLGYGFALSNKLDDFNAGAFRVDGFSVVGINNVRGGYSGNDVLNYHDNAGVNTTTAPLAFEINCHSIDPGKGEPFGSDQSSSTHENFYMIRVNGSYGTSQQDAILDASTNQSVNFGPHFVGDGTSSLVFNAPTFATSQWLIFPTFSDTVTKVLHAQDATVYHYGLPDGLTLNAGTGQWSEMELGDFEDTVSEQLALVLADTDELQQNIGSGGAGDAEQETLLQVLAKVNTTPIKVLANRPEAGTVKITRNVDHTVGSIAGPVEFPIDEAIDLTGATFGFKVTRDGVEVFSKTPTPADAGTAAQRAQVEIDAADTASLSLGAIYEYEFTLTLATGVWREFGTLDLNGDART